MVELSADIGNGLAKQFRYILHDIFWARIIFHTMQVSVDG
jgi:hypothetical protein